MKKKQMSARTLQRELKRVLEVLATTEDALKMATDGQASTERALANVQADLRAVEARMDNLHMLASDLRVRNKRLSDELQVAQGDLRLSREDAKFLREQLGQTRDDKQGYHDLAVIFGGEVLLKLNAQELVTRVMKLAANLGMDQKLLKKVVQELAPEALAVLLKEGWREASAAPELSAMLAELFAELPGIPSNGHGAFRG